MTASLSCYLYKRARSSGRNWKRRWFVFEEHLGNWIISYYKSEKDVTKKKKALGSVSLETANHDAAVMPVATSKEYSIEILPSDGTPALVVAAEDSVRYAEMLEHLKAFAHNVLSGYLFKRARKSGRNWKKRWFTADFTSRAIRIYEDMGVVSKPNKRGTIGNANDTIVFDHNCTVHSSGLRKHCMELQFGEGELSLFVAAENHEQFVRWRSAFDTLVTGGGHGLEGPITSTAPGHGTSDGGESVASQLLKSANSRAELVKTLSRHGSALLSFAHNENATTPTSAPSSSRGGAPSGRSNRHSMPPPRKARGRPPARVSRAPPKRATINVQKGARPPPSGAGRPPPPLPSAATRKSIMKRTSQKKASLNTKPGRGDLLSSITGFSGGLKHVGSPKQRGPAPSGPAHLRGIGGARNGLKSSKIPRKSEVASPPSTNYDVMRNRLKRHRNSIAGLSSQNLRTLSDDDDDFGDDSDDFMSD